MYGSEQLMSVRKAYVDLYNLLNVFLHIAYCIFPAASILNKSSIVDTHFHLFLLF